MRPMFVSALVGLALALTAVQGANEPGKEIQVHKTMPKPGGDLAYGAEFRARRGRA